MNKLTSFLALIALAALTGCATTNPLGPAAVEIAVQTAATYGVQKDPNVVPYLKAAAPVVCSMAGSEMLDPAAVVAALEQSNIEALKTPEATIIMNGALALYGAIYASYGEQVKTSQVQPYLQAVCTGLTMALPGNVAALAARAHPKQLPLVK